MLLDERSKLKLQPLDEGSRPKSDKLSLTYRTRAPFASENKFVPKKKKKKKRRASDLKNQDAS
jgi:hypothetical protein